LMQEAPDPLGNEVDALEALPHAEPTLYRH